ncbi:TPA: hypothetical protein ACGBG5_001718 [Enterococcus faecalis]
MALKITRSLNIAATIEIAEQPIMYLSASVNTDGTEGTNINMTTTNQDLYNQNRTACRVDIDAFEAEVRRLEDEIVVEKEQPA